MYIEYYLREIIFLLIFICVYIMIDFIFNIRYSILIFKHFLQLNCRLFEEKFQIKFILFISYHCRKLNMLSIF